MESRPVVLVTDDLFISPEHVERIDRAGYDVRREILTDVSSEDLARLLPGVTGYILGGTERVTEEVLASAESLRALVFTGSAYREFIPGHATATKRGIAIANTPGANAMAVAEYAVGLLLLMTRHMLALGRTGSVSFRRSRSLNELDIGIVGLGPIGRVLAANLRAMGAHRVLYNSRRRKYPEEALLGVVYCELDEMLRRVDVLVIAAARDEHAPTILGSKELALLRDGALLVNIAYADAVDEEALSRELSRQRLRAAYDAPPKVDLTSLPLDIWFCSNAQTAFNSDSATAATSEMATEALLDLLSSGESPWLVNPSYFQYAAERGLAEWPRS